MLVEIEGIHTYVEFKVINIVDGTSPYHEIQGIDGYIYNQTIINFEKSILMFEAGELRVVALLDSLEY